MAVFFGSWKNSLRFCLGHEPSVFFGVGGIQKAPYECFFWDVFFCYTFFLKSKKGI